MKKIIGLGLVVISLLLAGCPALAGPWQLRSGEEIIGRNQTIQGDLYFSGDILEVDGRITGDLTVFASRVIINGKVEGSLLGAVTEKIIIRGEIGGHLRVMTSQAELEGKIGKSLSALALQFSAKRDSVVETGILGYFGQVRLAGTIHGPVEMTVHSRAVIGGNISGNLTSKGAALEWLPPVEIGGRVDDYSGVSAQPGGKPQVKIGGGYHLHPMKTNSLINYKYLFMISVIWFMGNLLMTLIFFRIFPRTAWEITRPTPKNLKSSLVVGLVSFLTIPIGVVILTLTTVGVPLAIVLFLLYLILLTFAGVPFTLLTGRMILRKFDGKYPDHPYVLILGGALFSGVISMIPVIGFLLPTWLGFGMLLGNVKPQFKEVIGVDIRE
jgi:cytoskeletal protein CcmA (bactofilin family)